MGALRNKLVAGLRAYVRSEARVDVAETGYLGALESWVRALARQEIAKAATPPPVPTPVPLPPAPVLPSPTPAATPLRVAYTARMAAALATLSAPTAKGEDWTTFATAFPKDRHYYDVPWALWRLYALTGDMTYRVAAERESALYRQALAWNGDRTMAWPAVQAMWKPGTLLEPDALRRCYAMGQLAEYTVTKNGSAREATLALASTVLAALPQLLGGTPVILERTERNMAYAIYALAAGARINPGKFAAKCDELVTRAVVWNDRSPSGGFEHSLAAHDASECEDGWGGSPFMSALLVDALVQAAPEEPRLSRLASRVSNWLAASRTHDTNEPATSLTSYKYLVGCKSDLGYEAGWWQDINPMIVSAHGYAYRLTRDPKHLTTGNTMMEIGLREFRGDRTPKHFAQDAYGALLFAAV